MEGNISHNMTYLRYLELKEKYMGIIYPIVKLVMWLIEGSCYSHLLFLISFHIAME